MNILMIAYIDPGTGSFILQMLIAFFIGALFFFKIFWKKVKLFIIGIFQKKTD